MKARVARLGYELFLKTRAPIKMNIKAMYVEVPLRLRGCINSHASTPRDSSKVQNP